MIGIYSILNLKNNKRYIGSSNNIEKRINCHFSNLLKNKHCNKKLQNSYNKYGKSFFTYEILEMFEKIDKKQLLEIEQKYINNYDFNMLYNILSITNSGGAEALQKECLLLDLRGNVIKEFNSLKECSDYLNYKVQICSKSINNPSTVRLKYRVVTKQFYDEELELILSWRNYKSVKDKYNQYYMYDDVLKTWVVSHNSEIISLCDTEEEAVRISKHLCELINKNLL